MLVNRQLFSAIVVPSASGKVTGHNIAQEPLIARMTLKVHLIGIHSLSKVVVLAQFEAGHGEDGISVEATSFEHDIENRKSLRSKQFGFKGAETSPTLDTRLWQTDKIRP